MKCFNLYIVLLLFIGCKQNGQSRHSNETSIVQTNSVIANDNKEGVKFLTDFYTKYYGEYGNRKGIENFVSSRILNRMDSLSSDDNLILDYNPFIKGQDYDNKTLIQTLQVKPLKNPNEYRVSFLLFNRKDTNKTYVDLLLEKNKHGKFLISSILNDEYLNFKNENAKKQIASTQKLSLGVKEKNLEISLAEKKITLKNTIINEMSLSTSFASISDKEFYVMYENNASMTKTVEIYKFFYDRNNLKLSSKEVLKFGQEGISDNLFLYDNKLVDTSYDYEKLNNLESTIEDSFTKNPIRKNIFKNSKKTETKEYQNISPEEYFANKSTFK